MTRSFLVAITAGAGLLLVSGTVNAAQLTIEGIDPTNPFDTVSTGVDGGEGKDAWDAELKGRCEIIVAHPAHFQDEHLQLCRTVLSQGTEGVTAAVAD